MRRVFLIILVVGLVFGLDLRHPENNPGGEKGQQYGEKAKSEYSGKGQDNPTKTKLMQPLTQPDQQLTGPGGYKFNAPAVLCGQGGVKDEKVFARVVLSDNSITFSYASDPYSGVLDRTYSTSFTYLCPGGTCQSWDDTNKRFTSCVKYSISGGQIVSQSVDTLDGCVDPRKQGQLPSYFVGPLISDLLEYYKSIGKPITNSNIFQDTNGVAEYRGGKTEDCQGQAKNPSETQYLNNPYTMNDRALYYYFTCDPSKDPTCRVVKRVMDQETSSGTSTCVIQRDVQMDPIGRTDQRVCTPGQKLFPDGYNTASVACFSGDRFFDFSSYFWLECNSDGKGYVLKGWGYWEGAPCGSTEPFPPLPQVEVLYPMDQTVDWVQIGRLSVNRRRGGQGLSDGDRVSSPTELDCVSNDPTPMKVWLKNTFYSTGTLHNVLEVKIDNAPACNYFKWSNITGLVGEQIGDCRDFDKDDCKVVNEWWEDANGQRVQVIKNGNPVQQLTGCVEILRDEEVNKDWTSQSQTKQRPPQNCVWPPKTCKTISGSFGTRTECRQWWKKIREYKCSQTAASNYKFDPLKEKTLNILHTLDWDQKNTGQMSYTVDSPGSSACTNGQCYSVVRTQPMFVCPVNAVRDTSQSLCNTNCYEQIQCSSSIVGYTCSKTGTLYQDQSSCVSACREPATCSSPVYICPSNNNSYSDQQTCTSSCNNCKEQGQCSQSQSTVWVCSANGRSYQDQSSCQSSCNAQGSCNQEYYCNQGSLSGQNCVLQPTGSCPSPYSWDSSAGVCYASPQCSVGTYNTSRDRCETSPSCPSGFTFNPATQRCEASPTCPSGGTWNASLKKCTANPTQQCVVNSASCSVYHPAIGTQNVPMYCSTTYCSGVQYVYYNGSRIYLYCYVDVSTHYSGSYSYQRSNWQALYSSPCSGGTKTLYVYVYEAGNYATYNITGNMSYTTVCPSGYTLSGSTCVANPTCPSGSTYDSSAGVCYSTSLSCPSGTSLDSTLKVCYAQASCPSSGTLNTTKDRCETAGSLQCPSGWTLSGNQCIQPAQSRYKCSLNGQYYQDQSSCQSACVMSGTCSQQTQTTWSCSLGGTYQDQSSCQSNCVRDIPDCCVGKAQCTGDSQFYPADTCASQCFKSYPCNGVYNYTCPINGQTYSSSQDCSQACRKPVECTLQNVRVEKFVCNKTGIEYADLSACQQGCSAQNCNFSKETHYIGTAGDDPECLNGDKYCIVKKRVNGKVSFDTVQCTRSGTQNSGFTWTCPADDGVVVEDCKCGKDLKMGLGYTAGMIEVIYSAIKDRSCGP